MRVEMHPSVQKVAEFMQRELLCEELNAVANALPHVAAVIWAQHSGPEIRPMVLGPEVQRSAMAGHHD